MVERRCVCQKCTYCFERNRYELEKPLRIRRSKFRRLQVQHLREDSNRLLDSFIVGDISLNDLEVELETK